MPPPVPRSAACRGVSTLLIEKFSGDEPAVSVAEAADGVVLHAGEESFELTRRTARKLREALGEALSGRREFVHTAGEHRADGAYVVSRRGADSAGHSKVFESFAALEALYARLPAEFTAAEVGGTGLTGGRRHMLVRHFAEHPGFDCDLASRQPLTARKRR